MAARILPSRCRRRAEQPRARPPPLAPSARVCRRTSGSPEPFPDPAPGGPTGACRRPSRRSLARPRFAGTTTYLGPSGGRCAISFLACDASGVIMDAMTLARDARSEASSLGPDAPTASPASRETSGPRWTGAVPIPVRPRATALLQKLAGPASRVESGARDSARSSAMSIARTVPPFPDCAASRPSLSIVMQNGTPSRPSTRRSRVPATSAPR
jgi:hypothetical protein